MNHIIDNIFLGDFNTAENKSLLVKKNIKYIFNVAIECNPSDDIKKMGIFIHKYNIYDDYDININILNDIFNKIEAVEPSDGNILIHCAHGRSRSVCVILYYLMKKHNYSLEKSLELVKEKRPIIHPSPNYIKLLSTYDLSFNIDNHYVNYLKNNLELNFSEDKIIEIIKINNYDLNKIVNIII
jgi:hypothetical protein